MIFCARPVRPADTYPQSLRPIKVHRSRALDVLVARRIRNPSLRMHTGRACFQHVRPFYSPSDARGLGRSQLAGRATLHLCPSSFFSQSGALRWN